MVDSNRSERLSIILIPSVLTVGVLGGLWLLYWYEGPLEQLGLFQSLAAVTVSVVYIRFSLQPAG